MLKHTRRRALGLLIAVGAGARFISLPRAFAAEEGDEADEVEEVEQVDCYDSKDFGPWKGQATDANAGARISQIPLVKPSKCDLRVDAQVSATFEGRIVLYGDPDQTPLPKKFLIKPENRLIVRTEDGKEAIDEPLCGNCTDIFDDKVSIVLPLAVAPLFRESKSVDMAVKLGDKEECRFKLDCETLRKALDWATERMTALAEQAAEDKCVPPGGCFITTACCEALGLDDDCFELRALRRYRDHVLAWRPGGVADIAAYYEIAPLILARLPGETRNERLRSLYARYILPAAIAARLGLDTLTYKLYRRMLNELVCAFAPEEGKGAGGDPTL